jgi:hypothetical protein
MEDKRLQRLRQKLLDLLTLSEYYIRKPKYKKEIVVKDGVEYEKEMYVGEKVTHCKRKDWITAEKAYRGKSARERLRATCREINNITKEIRQITLEIDKEQKAKKKPV